MKSIEIIDTNAGNIHEYGMCGYKNIKQEGYRRKIEWVKQRFSEGMRYRILYSDEDGALVESNIFREHMPGDQLKHMEAEQECRSSHLGVFGERLPQTSARPYEAAHNYREGVQLGARQATSRSFTAAP